MPHRSESTTPEGTPTFLEDRRSRPGLREFVLCIREMSIAIRVEITRSDVLDEEVEEWLDAGEAILARRRAKEAPPSGPQLMR